MDLLKEEKRLIGKKNKALENLARKQKYLKSAMTSFSKARKELQSARGELRAIRKQIRAQGLEDLTISEPVEEESID